MRRPIVDMPPALWGQTVDDGKNALQKHYMTKYRQKRAVAIKLSP